MTPGSFTWEERIRGYIARHFGRGLDHALQTFSSGISAATLETGYGIAHLLIPYHAGVQAVLGRRSCELGA